jgi:Mn2+/Fe2+ NRAMP family transporter
MEGFIKMSLPPWMRRLITRSIAIIPAAIVILIFGEESGSKLVKTKLKKARLFTSSIINTIAICNNTINKNNKS